MILTNKRTQAQMDYVPTQTKNGNQFYWLGTIFAHNLTRELQMRTQPKERTTTPKRAALWAFGKMGTLRKKMIQRVGRIKKPGGVITLTMGGNQTVKYLISIFLTRLEATA